MSDYQDPNQPQAPPPPGQPMYAPEKPTHTPSLILGILALVTPWFTAGVGGIICGIIGMVLAKKAADAYKTTVGKILSIIGLIIGIVVLIATIAMVALGLAAMGLAAGLM